MVYTDREKLTVIDLSETKDILTFDELVPVLREKPTNMVYLELNGLLYGIVGMGAVDRAFELEQDFVVINKKFTYIHKNEYMRARQIFKDARMMTGKRINALPVIDECGRLIGDYSIWDDLFLGEHPEPITYRQTFEEITQKNERIAFVKPCGQFEHKQNLFKKWFHLLEETGFSIEVVDRAQILSDIDTYDEVLFIDADEWLGTMRLFMLLGKRCVTTTVIGFWKRHYDDICYKTFVIDIVRQLQAQGVYCLTYGKTENEHGYCGQINQMITDKFQKLGTEATGCLLPQMRREFHGENFNDEYQNQIMPMPFSISISDGIFIPQDQDTPLFHIHHGERLTIDQPTVYDRCIYMYGACFALNPYVADRHTIASNLQNRINLTGLKCKVVNLGLVSAGAVGKNYSFAVSGAKIATTPLKKSDVVILNIVEKVTKDIPYINAVDVYESHQIPSSWYVDDIAHCNHKCTKIMADTIYDHLLPVLREQPNNRNKIEIEDNSFFYYMRCYFTNYDPLLYQTIGSIVMNCNPFTLGHRYLIEEAIKRVDFLIIFVVEEDRSLFSFAERFAMVCDGVADLKNILVVPSGGFILSQITFPEYFTKMADEDLIRNTEADITLFAKRIAPKLGITHRFVGEELVDMVTNEYNNAMKRILPAYGIELVEIPRMKAGGETISATSVRKYIEEGNDEALNSLIPESTRRILYQKNN